MAISKVENVWRSSGDPPIERSETPIESEPLTRSTEVVQTADAENDTIAETVHYRITEQMERVREAALTATEQSQRAFSAAQDADRNARAVTEVTQKSVEEANQAIEQTNTFIEATNHAAERALRAAQSARRASHQAFEFTRRGMLDLAEMEASMRASEERAQNIESNQLFQRTQNLKQQTASLRQQLGAI